VITLRPLRGEDADTLYPLLAGTAITDTLQWNGPDSLDEYRESLLTFAERTARGESYHFAIVAGELAVGCIGVRPIDPFRGDIGLWIGHAFQNRGVGTEAVGLATRRAFLSAGFNKLEAGVFVGNVASRRVFEKNGFELESTIRCSVRKRDQSLDEWRFGLLRQQLR
jgi:RimJ/RimL family protein N-acetyltransferase